MKELIVENRFKRDLKLARKRGLKNQLIEAVVSALRSGLDLPPRNNAHRLSGSWGGVWECHLQPHWLLVYDFDELSVTLIRTGTHSDLFE